MPPWSAIDTVMFDMDGTLLDLHFDNFFWTELIPREFGRKHGVTESAAKEIITCKYAGVKGTLSWYCLDYWRTELDLDIVELKLSVRHKIKIRPSVEKLLLDLQAANKRLLLVTNAHPDSLSLKTGETGIGDYFHHCVSSHRLERAKENHGFWQALQSIENYDPERTLLFDDSLPVLRQAKREGIRHLYAIAQPDSKQAHVEPAEFPQVEDFALILPANEKQDCHG